jgi:hypothetical protein
MKKQREIKFRAWDGTMRRMWYPETLSYDGSDTFYAFYNNKQKTIGWGLYDRKLENRLVSGAYEDAVLMQYTGLKDRDGKDWYEGDLVRVSDTAPIHETFWDENQMGWKIRGGNPKSVFNINAPLFKIIGNIYENGNLLHENKDGK